jgi:hypothetical protein
VKEEPDGLVVTDIDHNCQPDYNVVAIKERHGTLGVFVRVMYNAALGNHGMVLWPVVLSLSQPHLFHLVGSRNL